jgi:hypothetical protein
MDFQKGIGQPCAMQRLTAHRIGLRLALALGMLWARSGRADEPRLLDLTWRAPAECSMGAEMERRIARLSGTAPRDRGVLRAVVDIWADERGWHAHVATDYGGEAGERTLEGPTCHAVARAAALVIALTIDSNAGHLDELPPPPNGRERDSVPKPTRVTEAAHRSLVRGSVAAGPRSELGLLQSPGFGIEIALGARVPAASLEIVGAGYLPENITVPNTGVGGRFTLLTVELRACPNLLRGSIELFACASAGLGRLSAEGFGVTAPGSAATTLGILAVGPGVGFFLSPVHRLGIGGDVTYAPGRARFVLQNIGLVHQAAQIGGSARFEVTWYW